MSDTQHISVQTPPQSISRSFFHVSKFAAYFAYTAASVQVKSSLNPFRSKTASVDHHLFEDDDFIKKLDSLIRSLNLTLKINGELELDRGSLIVANHISWVDALVLAKLAPFSFIAKQEVKNWPLVGPITQRCQVQFIDRHNKFSVYRDLPSIQTALENHQNVVLFPEGTTTKGTETTHFYPMFFETAVRTNSPIQAIAIQYQNPQGFHLPEIAFIDDDLLVDTLLRMFRHQEIQVHLNIFPPFQPKKLNRKQCALKAKTLIDSALS